MNSGIAAIWHNYRKLYGQKQTMREIYIQYKYIYIVHICVYIYIYKHIYRKHLTFQSPMVALKQHVLQETMHFLQSVFTSVLRMIRRVNTH